MQCPRVPGTAILGSLQFPLHTSLFIIGLAVINMLSTACNLLSTSPSWRAASGEQWHSG